MAFSVAFMVLAIMTQGSGHTVVDTVTVLDSQETLAGTDASQAGREMSAFARYKQVTDQQVLLQTELVVAPGRAEATHRQGSASTAIQTFQKVLSWLPRTERPEGRERERFHKDFLAAALIICSVLPWGWRNVANAAHSSRQSGLRRLLPSKQVLRFVSVLLMWLKHYWFQNQNTTFDIALFIIGFVFDFGQQRVHGEDNLWTQFADLLPERFVKLSPVYTLHVLVCYLVFFASPCIADYVFAGMPLLLRACGLAMWLSSVAFGCYLVLPVLVSPPHQLQPNAALIVCAACGATVLLPRTLAAPVHSPWVWQQASLIQPSPNDVLFNRSALLISLAQFFFGLVFSRLCRMANQSCWFTGSFAESKGKQLLSDRKEQARGGRKDAVSWEAFGEEAMQEIVRSFSISEHQNPVYDLSPQNSAD